VYLLSMAMSMQDDTCKALIDSVEEVFKDCGIKIQKPDEFSFLSMEDFDVHSEEVWDDIRQSARSK